MQFLSNFYTKKRSIHFNYLFLLLLISLKTTTPHVRRVLSYSRFYIHKSLQLPHQYSNNSTSKQLSIMLDWYLIFHFWSGPNLKINMPAKIQDGQHMATQLGTTDIQSCPIKLPPLFRAPAVWVVPVWLIRRLMREWCHLYAILIEFLQFPHQTDGRVVHMISHFMTRCIS